jgi:hypothetical protein
MMNSLPSYTTSSSDARSQTLTLCVSVKHLQYAGATEVGQVWHQDDLRQSMGEDK